MDEKEAELLNKAVLAISDCITALEAAKPAERSERARLYAIAITEVEKTRAVLCMFLLPISMP